MLPKVMTDIGDTHMALDLDQLTADCKTALEHSAPSQAVRDIVSRAVSDTTSVVAALGEPTRAEIQRLHVSDELTILNVVWAPKMTLMPHNHNMWAVIGVYGGREDNIFWRRCKDDPNGRVEAAGAKSLGPQDVRPFGPEIIHSVTNPTSQFTGAIHIYGGDFFAVERSEWSPDNLEERPYDLDKNLKIFEDANKNL
jgi:predicted metal-dependent enzyme (double-stranded beta helix superfamily)